MLRSQVERLQSELHDYRKRVAAGNVSRTPPAAVQSKDSWTSGNDFQFDFPVFGTYPFPPVRSKSDTQNPAVQTSTSSTDLSARGNPYTSSTSGFQQPPMNTPMSTGVDAFSELFSPSILAASVSMSPASEHTSHKGSIGSVYKGSTSGSMDHSHSNSSIPQLSGGSSLSNSASPSVSSVSQHGPGSSCGTSPEPSGNSPANSKGIDSNLKTISEENAAPPSSFLIKTPSAELNGIDWLAQQNGGQFNPDLFGDYRESQDAIATADFGGFFNEAFPLPDLGSPPASYETAAPGAPKAKVPEGMDKKKYDDIPVMPREKATPDMLSMSKIWSVRLRPRKRG
jgi:AP-1-like factor